MKKTPAKEKTFVLYKSPEGAVAVEVLVQDETVWLTQKRMAEVFGVEVNTVNYHLKETIKNGELQEDSVIRKIRTTAADGKSYETQFYNLDAIISVGYRVNSIQATHFRKWATTVLRDYIIKGFALDDELLKNGTRLGQDYFRELLERVRSIRASERRIYQQITDIFAECSIDYDPASDLTKNFYAMVQNKFHYAISGRTAAELIYAGADRSKANMGLATWKHAPDGRILKSDAAIAKNYLPEADIKRLERTVSGYFDYIERLIEGQTVFTMEALAESVNKFLAFNEYRVLDGKGSVSHDQAERKAHEEYAAFDKTQRIVSDFDKFIEKAEGLSEAQAPQPTRHKKK